MTFAAITIGSVLVLLIWLAVIGLVAGLLCSYVPMPQPIKGIIVIVAVLLALFVVLNAFGMLDGGAPRIDTR